MTTNNDFDVFDQLEHELSSTAPPQCGTTLEDSDTDVSFDDSPPICTSTSTGTVDTCRHENLSGEYGVCVCLDCGLEVKRGVSNESKMYTSIDNRSMGDGNRCWAPKKKNKSIRDDVKGLGIPDPIINEADSIFKIVTKGGIFRVDKRRSIIVACLFEAYKIKEQHITLASLLEKFPINNVTVGMKIVETKIKEYDIERKRITYTSTTDSIRDILAGWNSDPETVEKVITLYKQIEGRSKTLNRSRAKSEAAAVVYYYALATGRKNIKLKEFSQRVGLSETTITKYAKEISYILQTPEILAY
jgi:hypothetical protein